MLLQGHTRLRLACPLSFTAAWGVGVDDEDGGQQRQRGGDGCLQRCCVVGWRRRAELQEQRLELCNVPSGLCFLTVCQRTGQISRGKTGRCSVWSANGHRGGRHFFKAHQLRRVTSDNYLIHC